MRRVRLLAREGQGMKTVSVLVGIGGTVSALTAVYYAWRMFPGDCILILGLILLLSLNLVLLAGNLWEAK